MNDDFRNAIEEIKLRASIEDVVRERVHGLRRAGRLYEACCPFHEEKTPSFKVDPIKGYWHCWGSCSEGGDVIDFVSRADNVGFREALEILAAQTGVELPRSKRGDGTRNEPLYEALERTAAYYGRALRSAEGRVALEYLQGRGFTQTTLEAFGLGYAPAGGQAVVEATRRAGLDPDVLLATGVLRRSDDGRVFDFFRGRLMIPIRDLQGRVVGFGGRRLDDEAGGPKYINTAETRLFKKSRLIYGLDRAAKAARKNGELVLVEGYTDVIAAHQAGVSHVAAVLGTSTTEDHAALLRRVGAKRVRLLFDGDDAGRQAAVRALHGLLPLEVEIEVAELPPGTDPCDLLLSEGAEGFERLLAGSRTWFEYVTAELDGLAGLALSRKVDGVLELLGRLSKPVHREAHLTELAATLGMPVDTLRSQWDELPKARERRRAPEPAPEVQAAVEPTRTERPRDPRLRRVFGGMIGAAILDNSLLPRLRLHAPPERVVEEDLRAILEAILQLDDAEVDVIDVDQVLTALGEAGARKTVVPLVDHARAANSPTELFEGELEHLETRALNAELERVRARIAELEALAPASDSEQGEELKAQYGLFAELQQKKRTTHPNETFSQAG